jgi:hypothetical protein
MLVLRGKITSRDPGSELGPFFRKVHEAAKQDRISELKIDVTELAFVNSSSIRLFVDWATWLKQEIHPTYILRFITDRTITWQRTSFVALTALAKEVVAVQARA